MKLCPYGKSLADFKPVQDCWLYFGSNSWECARARAANNLPTLLLPPDENPSDYRWPVHGWNVFAVQVGDFPLDDIKPFDQTLVNHGAAKVYVLFGDEGFVIYQGRQNDRAA